MYLDKINKSCKDNLVSLPCSPSLAIPHQSFTPREILAQFVRNDVQVQRFEPTDQVDSMDAMSFEDEFEARQFVANELPEIIEQRKQSDLEKRQAELDSKQQQEQQQQEQQQQREHQQQQEHKPVKVEVVKPETPYTTGKGPYD